MPHPCEVLPPKKILRDLLHEVDPPALLNLEQLVRLICSQQLRLERRVEEGVGFILEELRHTTVGKKPGAPVREPEGSVCELGALDRVANATDALQIKPTPATHSVMYADANTDANGQGNGDRHVDANAASEEDKTAACKTNRDLSMTLPYQDPEVSMILGDALDPKECVVTESSTAQVIVSEASKGNGLLLQAASDVAQRATSSRQSIVGSISTASKKMYDKYSSKQKTVSIVNEFERSVKRLPHGMLRSTALRCTACYRCLLQLLKKLCEHPAFGGLAASFIIFNAVIMAASVDHLAHHDEEAPWMTMCATMCNVFFIVELVMRLSYQGLGFFTSAERYWNNFDFSMVVLIGVELIVASSRLNVGQSIKMVKIVRIVRIFRLFKFFEDLSLMVVMIAGSIKSLVWAWILIWIIIFSFSIVLTQFTTFYLNETHDSPEQQAQAFSFFGTIPRTVYHLIQAMLNGKSWGEYTDVLLHVDSVALVVFFCYIALMMIAVMNVITGVFVQDAIKAAGKQRDIMISTELRAREQHLENMLELFTAMDADGSGEISLEEAKEFFKQEMWAAYFNAQGLDVTEAEWIFNILDVNRNGSIPFDDFVDGCFKLKGPAKRTDVAALSQAVHRLYNQTKSLTAILDPQVPRVSDHKESFLACEVLLPHHSPHDEV